MSVYPLSSSLHASRKIKCASFLRHVSVFLASVSCLLVRSCLLPPLCLSVVLFLLSPSLGLSRCSSSFRLPAPLALWALRSLSSCSFVSVSRFRCCWSSCCPSCFRFCLFALGSLAWPLLFWVLFLGFCFCSSGFVFCGFIFLPGRGGSRWPWKELFVVLLLTGN